MSYDGTPPPPPPPPPHYVQPVYPPPVHPVAPVYMVPAPRHTNGVAVASLITGICAWVVFPFVLGIVAIITGHIARGQIRRSGDDGGGFAIAGLILGYLNVVISVLGLLLFIGFWALLLAALGGASTSS